MQQRPPRARSSGVAARHAVALALAAAVLGFGVTGCGGADSSSERATEAAQTQWRSGLTKWSNEMIRALNGISVLFSTPRTVELLQRRDQRTNARLERLQETLEGCAAKVRRLGPAPEPLAEARRYAIRACSALERGSRLVRAGVEEWQNGLGMEHLNEGTELLGTGQEAIVLARIRLKAPAPE